MESTEDPKQAPEARIAELERFIDEEVMPRYCELLDAVGIPRYESVLIDLAKQLLRR